MGDEHRPSRRGDYRSARIGAAAALVIVVVCLLLVDALSPYYAPSEVTLSILLGSILTLLGIELVGFWKRS